MDFHILKSTRISTSNYTNFKNDSLEIRIFGGIWIRIENDRVSYGSLSPPRQSWQGAKREQDMYHLGVPKDQSEKH